MKIDEKLSLSSTLFSCLDWITTGRNPNWPLGLRRVSPARAARERGASLARRVSVGPQSRACAGARCPVWSTERASTARTRNPAEAKRPGAEQKNRGFDRARHSENARTNPPRMRWQEIHNLFYILRFDQKHKTNWHLTTWPDCENEPELDQQRLAITREGASVLEWVRGRCSIENRSKYVRDVTVGEDGSRNREGPGDSRYAMICEAGASHGAYPSGSLGTRKSLTVRARCQTGRRWQQKPRGVRRITLCHDK